MENFQDIYDKACQVLRQQTFESEVQAILRKDVEPYLDITGPKRPCDVGLERLRLWIKGHSRGGASAFLHGGAGGVAETILRASNCNSNDGKGFERAATLKMLMHLYLVDGAGGQELWFYSPPKAYVNWIYDELKMDQQLITKLGKDTEVHSAGDRKAIADAVQNAQVWCMKTLQRLGTPDNRTKATVKNWFCDEISQGNEQLDEVIAILREGFKLIAVFLDRGRLILSDHPGNRAGNGHRKFAAAVDRRDFVNVVYVTSEFLDESRWRHPLALIHECSHKMQHTSDHRYSQHNLCPHETDFPLNETIDNADSWAYFAADLNEELPAYEAFATNNPLQYRAADR